MQSFLLKIDVAKIIIHKRDQPSTFLNFFETDSLPGEDCAEIDLFAVQANAPTAGDADGVVVERIIEIGQALIGTCGRPIDFGRTFHTEALVRTLVVKLLDEMIEPGLLLKTVEARGTRRFLLEREMHAFVSPVLLGTAGPDPFDADAQTKPPHREPAEIE